MPFKQKVPKTVASITLTPEAWAILAKRSKDHGLSKSEYIENLVRRGDLDIYDMVRDFLIEELIEYRQIITRQELQIYALQNRFQLLEDFLKRLGVSPNQIP